MTGLVMSDMTCRSLGTGVPSRQCRLTLHIACNSYLGFFKVENGTRNMGPCTIWYRAPLRKCYECYKDVAVHIPGKQHNRVDEIIAFLQPAKEPEGQKRTPKWPRKRL